ncbi:hypothetical protein M409DRAFT_25661 [Zasmidium cellare ATCC 36951]|uniref:PHD finger and BAH domain protein n=1 Tax=Zasmidium cellare ATCC 36951 TaxID=1080233 RepID=A0A6A6CA39_ZASCE|nr:uncharacterized protein M409DRAFT_25661 [Zasmidium cellare ATCC 36951]KAF2163885.1 hypothetical protein M409DRAFT_25661 [Zasmidium cellare ATCC 36951]
MAQPAPDEVLSIAQAAPNASSKPASRAATPASTPIGFQAVNAVNFRAVAENLAATGSDAALSQSAPSTAQPAKPPSQSDALDATMAEASYGTRSRNRNNARPNYAEDQDMDFEFAPATKKNMKSSEVPAASESRQAPPSFVAVNNSQASSATTPAHTAVPAASAGPTKKRKAAGTPAALHTPTASSTPPPAASRKPTASAASSTMARETNIMTFTKHRSSLNKKGELVADDGTKLSVNDHVYLVCEPPGDPYYLCRIMEFLHVDSGNPNSPIDSLRVNWYYRPRDVQRFSNDTRLVYATMHSDMCPLTSLRGKCTIKHRSEIEDLELYRKERDSFYFVQVFDRFIRRTYECIPVQQIINVPDKVKKALDERWKFVVVEIGRIKELTSAAKTCKRCARYCASNDSVDCAICKNSYHMNCVQPPLPKKPSRGFAWACGPCSRASEKKMEATPTHSAEATEAEEEETAEEEAPGASNDTTRAPSPIADDMIVDDHPATQAEIALAKMWPMRYLGIHARVEDALQYDDRAIYPRASSRLGPRHQANVSMWHGRPVELVKPAEIKKRYNKAPAGKKEGKLTKETLAAIEADREEKAKRPKWVQDEPAGYVARGEDYDAKDPRCTAKLMFKMPTIEEHPQALAGREGDPIPKRQELFMDIYFDRAKSLARIVGVPSFGTNFTDKAMELLAANNYKQDAALKQLSKIDRVKDLHEPVLSKSDLVKFEEGVAKYGSEHRLIRLHMKTTLPHSDIVRFYYLWKKTPKGREIWGNYGGRKKRKVESDVGAKLQIELANDVDDSAFDNDKAVKRNRGFQCKFCNTYHSRQWRRAPGVSPGQLAPPDSKAEKKDKRDRSLLALCLRCAGLWRKYAIQWEEIDEVAKKVASGGGRAWKRKIDEELLRELLAANEAATAPRDDPGLLLENGEPPKKKSKTDKEVAQAAAKKEKPPPPPKEPTPPPPPIIPAQPTWKVLPCAVCKISGETIACAHCKLTVHRRCFGVGAEEGVRANGDVHWVCEQCQNDRNPTVSTDYSCCLCLTEETQVDLVEPPKISHKKKTDREREKERLEKELADGMRAEYRSRQLMHNRPVIPREPLKRTTGNNWVHVQCAVWAPEIRFSNAKVFEIAEGFQLIPQQRYEAVCKLCKNKDHQNRLRENAGACVNCFHCSASFHASCAFEAGYTFGFDVQPVKGSRKDQIMTATLGQETGALTAIIICKEHTIKGIVHPIHEIVDDSGKTALQVYSEAYKQADLTLTGTVRKAAQAQLTKDKGLQPASAQGANRRESGAHSIAAAVRRGARTSSLADTKAEADDGSNDLANVAEFQERRCAKCNIDATPKWHPVIEDTKVEPAPSPRPQGDTNDAGQENPGEPPRPQNIRFMAPGMNGRAWDGMPDRHGPRPMSNGDRVMSEAPPGIPVGTPVRDASLPLNINGDRPMTDDFPRRETEEVFHNHALPRYQNPAEHTPPPLPEDEPKDKLPEAWLCHKCFLKKKLDPTPPPSPGDGSRSPTRVVNDLDILLDSDSLPKPNIEEQFELWDRPPVRPSVPPPPQAPINGMGPQPPHFGSGQSLPPPMHGYGPPQPNFGQQPNGYPEPPRHHYDQGLPPPPVPHHHNHNPNPFWDPQLERHGAMGYQPPSQTPPNVPQHSRPPSLNGYPPQGQPMTNGMSSPRNGAPPILQSPSFPHGPPHQQHPNHQQYQHVQQNIAGPAATEVSRTLPVWGFPDNSTNDPTNPYSRPRSEVMNGQPQQHTPSQPHMAPSQPGASPQAPMTWPDGQPPRPSTPRDAQTNGFPNTSGASASPNLMNLIH